MVKGTELLNSDLALFLSGFKGGVREIRPDIERSYFGSWLGSNFCLAPKHYHFNTILVLQET